MKFGMFRKDRGSAMILISLVIMIITVLGMVYSMTTLSTHKLTQSYRNGDRALAGALAGMEYGLHKLSYLADPAAVDFAEEITLDGQVIKVNSKGTELVGEVGSLDMTYNVVVVETETTVGGVTRGVRTTVYNDSYAIHELFYKAIFAANSSGLPYTLEFTGKDNDADRIRGDAHNNGDISFSLNAFATWNWGNNKCTATGWVGRVDELGVPNLTKGGNDPYITAPDLRAMGYDSETKRYREWDPASQGGGRNVVSVGEAYDHYTETNIKISREGGYFSGGGYYEWNTSAKTLPDSALANFFQYDYQNHYVKSYTAADDTRIDATKNYYVGQRNGGTSTTYGALNGLYGGGHAVITINQEQNNKVYYVDGNLWFDSDGCNHLFFVPGPGVDKLNITIVVNGSVYIGDQICTVEYDSGEIYGDRYSTFNLLDEDSGVAIVAMADGESYDDVNKNGKYDVGETILGRSNPATPVPAVNNPSPAGMYSTGYRGRMEGSGNVVFGDTIDGPIGMVETFLYAENNFVDITSSGSDQASFTYGNMTAGNHVYLNRNYADWQQLKSMSCPTGWINIGGRFYPPGTTAEMAANPFITQRSWYGGKLYTRRHNPLKVKLDERILDGTIVLPGLPHSTSIHEGTWVPLAMQVIEGRVLDVDWVSNP